MFLAVENVLMSRKMSVVEYNVWFSLRFDTFYPVLVCPQRFKIEFVTNTSDIVVTLFDTQKIVCEKRQMALI